VPDGRWLVHNSVRPTQGTVDLTVFLA
jgi:hypothetical protein